MSQSFCLISVTARETSASARNAAGSDFSDATALKLFVARA